MEEKRSKKKVIISIIVGLILIAGIGLTIAYFSSKSNSDDKTITTGNLSIAYENESTFNLSNLTPLYESEIESEAAKVNFTVTNNGNVNEYIKINLENIYINGLTNYDVKWALYQENEKITTGTFSNFNDTTINMVVNEKIEVGMSKVYNVYIWINETETIQNGLMNGTISGNIEVQGLSKKEKTLSSAILGENKSNVITDAPTFTKNSTDKGLYVQKGDDTKSNFGFPTYYYRGAVENNYVQMGEYYKDIYTTINGVKLQVANANDPILWRIVRINEDGSIKLITDKSITENEVYSTLDNPCFYYSELEYNIDYFTSDLRNNYKDKLQNITTCHDIRNVTESGSPSMQRISSNNPTFVCPDDDTEEKYLCNKNYYNSFFGTISADEAIFSGALYGGEGSTYLANETETWTTTPSQYYGYNSDTGQDEEIIMYTIINNHIDFWRYRDKEATVRAAINLKSDVLINSGNGTKDSPYIIK